MNLNERRDNHPCVGLVKQEVTERDNVILALVKHEVRANKSETVPMEYQLESQSPYTCEAEIISNWTLELKPEIPDRDCDFESDANAFIKQELLHEELNIKIEDVTIKQETHLDYEYNLGNKLSTSTTTPKEVKSFSGHKSNLKRHLNTGTGEKPFKCHICDYCSAHNGHLEMHLITHTGEKPFKCNICNYECGRKSSLTRHLITHTGKKPFKCNICEYCCTQNGHLKSHLKTHTGERPLKCNVCDYCCSQNSALKVHLRTHTGEKPFKCNICNYCFARNSGLQRHLRTHTGEESLKCNICDYRSRNTNGLKKHLKTHTQM